MGRMQCGKQCARELSDALLGCGDRLLGDTVLQSGQLGDDESNLEMVERVQR